MPIGTRKGVLILKVPITTTADDNFYIFIFIFFFIFQRKQVLTSHVNHLLHEISRLDFPEK